MPIIEVMLSRTVSEGPYGLTDVFAMHLRPHRRLAPREVYETKAEEYKQRWPSVTADRWT